MYLFNLCRVPPRDRREVSHSLPYVLNLLGQDQNAVSDSALECFGRGNNLLRPTGAPSLIIRSMPLATGVVFNASLFQIAKSTLLVPVKSAPVPPGPLPALCKSDTGFQFPATTLDFLRIPKQGIALSAC
jgi:hypothetical protein